MNEFVEQKIDSRDILGIVSLGIFAAAGLQGFIAFSGLHKLFPAYIETVQGRMFSYPFVYKVMLYGIASPAIEEILFRWGLFLVPIKKLKLNVFLAGFISSVLFGLSHGNMVQFCYAFLFGLLLSFEAYGHKNIAAPILSHGAANVFTVSMYEIGVEFDPVWALALIPAILIFLIRNLAQRKLSSQSQ